MYMHLVAVPDLSTPYGCLLFLVPVSAGYPSPAGRIDDNECETASTIYEDKKASDLSSPCQISL